MTLSDWRQHGWLRTHESDPQELGNLFKIVDREMRDASVPDLSLDAQLRMLYNAALKLADIALRRAGYRAATGARQHYYVIQSLRFTLGDAWRATGDFLDEIRRLRHRADYESVGFATEAQTRELRGAVERLRQALSDQ